MTIVVTCYDVWAESTPVAIETATILWARTGTEVGAFVKGDFHVLIAYDVVLAA